MWPFQHFFFVVRLHFWRLNFVIGTCPSPLFDQEQPDGAIRFFFESTELFDLALTSQIFQKMRRAKEIGIDHVTRGSVVHCLRVYYVDEC